MIVAIGAMILPWNWSYLFQHFLQEENPVIITILFLFISLGGAALAATAITFLVWLIREVYQEINYRWLPQRDYIIAALFFAFGVFFTVQCFGNNGAATGVSAKFPIIFWSLILGFAGIYFRIKEGKGYETRTTLFLGAMGCLIFLHSMELVWFEGIFNQFEMSQYVTLTVYQEEYRNTITMLIFCVMLYYCFYLLSIYGLKFETKGWQSNHIRLRIAILLGGIVLSLFIGIVFSG